MGLRRQMIGTDRPSRTRLWEWQKQKRGLGGVLRGHGKRLLDFLKEYEASRQGTQERKA